MAYDQMGNYTDAVDPYAEELKRQEEERKKREQEIANTAVRTQQSTTYADGSQTHKTTTEVAAPVAPEAQNPAQTYVNLADTAGPQVAYQAPAAGAGRGFVNPAAATQPQPQPVAPVVPDQAQYNASIARQESGANPNIGYHNPAQGTAYGAYGITAPAYADARRVNPALPADIAQASPEQQNQAMNAYTAQNAKYLKNYGVEPTQQNLSAAHFLGAKGLADYLQSGTISPAAAAANGGEERVREIVNARLGGQQAPASGATQPAPVAPETLTQPAPSPYSLATGQPAQGLQAPAAAPAAAAEHPAAPFIDAYHTAQDDPMALLKLRSDTTAPDWIKSRAGQRAYDLMHQERGMDTAKQEVTQKVAAAAAGDAKASKEIASTLSSKEGSYAKMILLGFISPQLAGEEAVKLGFGNKWAPAMDAKGNSGLIEYNAKGLPLQGTKSDGAPMSQSELTAYASEGSATKTAANMPSVHGTPVQRLNPETKQVETGLMMYDPRSKASYIQVGNERKPTTGWTTMAQTPGSVFNAAAAGAAGKGAGEGYTPGAVAGLPGVPGTGTTGMGGAAVAAVAPVAPGAAAMPVTPGVPVAPSAIAPVGGIAQQKQAEQIGTKQIEERNTANQKYSDEMANARQTAVSQTSTINRLQSAIDKNPNFWGIDTNSPTWRAFVDVNSSNENKAESLNTLARNLNIPKDKRTEFDQTMNDYRALQVNAITGSGLTASQTNTERESQRVIGTIGSISDRPAAAKATLEYAKAKIEYADAKARAWADARKTNPGIDRLDFETNFDKTQGEKIFKDANERMAKIIGGNTSAASSEGQKSTSKSGKPIVYRNGQWEYQ